MKIKSIRKIESDKPIKFYDVVNAYPYNNFLIKTNTGYICSHNCIFANFTDEVNFGLTNDVEKLKNPEYAARYAREKYLYSKDGEKILKID